MAKKILIVDDEPDVLKVTVFRLKKAGYEVISAVNGQEGLDMAGREKPDLILLDLILPLLSGYDVCKKIKADAKIKSIPVILFTASTTEDMAKKVMETGAQDYITKPFEAQELVDKIKKFIG